MNLDELERLHRHAKAAEKQLGLTDSGREG